MKASVKKLVDSIEREIEKILENAEKTDYNAQYEFELGSFTYEIILTDNWSKWEEARDNNLHLEVKSVSITNKNDKVLPNISNEVFNQLEDNYTNY